MGTGEISRGERRRAVLASWVLRCWWWEEPQGLGWKHARSLKGCIPMSLVLTASGRLNSVTNFFASSRTSMTLLRRANTGASGKEATKRVTKPNWMTRREHAGESSAGSCRSGVHFCSVVLSPPCQAPLPACLPALLGFLLNFCSQSQGWPSESKLYIRHRRQRRKRCMTRTPFHNPSPL